MKWTRTLFTLPVYHMGEARLQLFSQLKEGWIYINTHITLLCPVLLYLYSPWCICDYTRNLSAQPLLY